MKTLKDLKVKTDLADKDSEFVFIDELKQAAINIANDIVDELCMVDYKFNFGWTDRGTMFWSGQTTDDIMKWDGEKWTDKHAFEDRASLMGKLKFIIEFFNLTEKDFDVTKKSNK